RGQAPRRRAPREALLPAQPLGQVGADQREIGLTFNPQELPVLGTDLHLPAIHPERLTPSALRARFAAPPAWTPEIKTEGRHGDREPAHASVLVPLVLRDEL